MQSAIKNLHQASQTLMGSGRPKQGSAHPLLKQKVLNLTGLKLTITHLMSFFSHLKSHQHPGTDIVETGKPSLKDLIGG